MKTLAVGLAVWIAAVLIGSIFTMNAEPGSPATGIMSLAALVLAVVVAVRYHKRQDGEQP